MYFTNLALYKSCITDALLRLAVPLNVDISPLLISIFSGMQSMSTLCSWMEDTDFAC
jgi:hypothetical protein